MLKIVSADLVPMMWDKVKHWLASALDHGQDDYTIDHVQSYLSSGQWMLLVSYCNDDINGAAAVSFFNRPSKRVAFVIATGGRMVSDPATFVELQTICRGYGATHIEGAARESVARLWTRNGFTEKYRIVEVVL